MLKLIKYGHITYRLQNNNCILVISCVKGLKKVVYLLNGELRTPKIHLIYDLIDWLNKNHSTEIIKLPCKKKPLWEDSWLSGFIDSDGSFSIQHSKIENEADKRKISCRLRIEQKMLDPITNNNYIDILTDISNFLNCSLKIREQKSTSNKYFILTASNKVSLKIILNYLEQYPLFSSKYLDYNDWKEIVLLIFQNEHLTNESIIKANFVKNHMNKKRTLFYWDHLNLLSL